MLPRLHVLVRVPKRKSALLQQRRHVLDVVDGRDAQALELLAEVVAQAEEDGATTVAGVLNIMKALNQLSLKDGPVFNSANASTTNAILKDLCVNSHQHNGSE